MHVVNSTAQLPKAAAYRELQQQLAALFAGERNGLANAANMSALLYEALPNLNWVGFYFLQAGELVLGRGVCGTAAERRETVIVADVSAFPGHIACDAASRSEIVIPLIKEGRLLGVLDLDSPQLARFDQEDGGGLNAALALLVQSSDWGRFLD